MPARLAAGCRVAGLVVLLAVVAVALLGGHATAQAAKKAAKPATVFYPGKDNRGAGDGKDYARWILKLDVWAGRKHCEIGKPVPDTDDTIRTIAGYSLGRLGVLYFLKRAGEKRLDQLRTVILIDPGNKYDFTDTTDGTPCEANLDPDGLLADWVTRNKDNRIIVLAGERTFDEDREKLLQPSQRRLFKGILEEYLPAVARSSVGNGRTVICAAENYGAPYTHESIIKKFAWVIGGSPNGCPAPSGALPFYGFAPAITPYAGRIVKWSEQKPSPVTAWLVGADGKRRWIPDGGTFKCLSPTAGRELVLRSTILDLLPDATGVHATCGSVPAPPPPPDPRPQPDPDSTPSGPTPSGTTPGGASVTLAQGPAAPKGFRYAIRLAGFAPGASVRVDCHDSVDPGGFFSFTLVTDAAGAAYTESQCYSADGPEHWVVAGGVASNRVVWSTTGPPAPPPPAPTTWAEQQGSLGANTFLNPYNASGMGSKIAAYQWVQVSCKVYAPQIASANPDGYWYRIASPPWNNAYYAVANTFWNGDVPRQKPYTHNTDFAVPNC